MIRSPTTDSTILLKGGADDHADGEIDHVALHRERLEFLYEGSWALLSVE